MLQDVRYSLRMWRRSPGVCLAAVATLAVGIGASTTIYSAMNAIVFNAMPWANPDALVHVFQRYRPEPNMDRMSVAPANYLDWRVAESLESMVGYRHVNLNLSGDAEPERVRGLEADVGLFDVLGATPAMGRVFQAADASSASAHSVAVISHTLWERRFEAAADIVGRSVLVNGHGVTVVGVMPKAFRFPIGWLSADVEMWVPLVLTPGERIDRQTTGFNVIARLRDGTSLEQAQTELDLIAGRLEDAYPETNAGWATTVFPMSERVASGLGRVLGMLALAVGVILLIACVNVANLLLARGLDRQAELTIRAAVGAGRHRLVRQLLTEGVLLSVVGGAAGVVLAFWAVAALRAMAPAGDLRDLALLQVDGAALAFAAGLSVVVGAVFSLLPALTQSRVSLRHSLHDGARGSDSSSRSRLKSTLIVVELALAALMLVCASVLLRTFQSVMTVDPGFDAANAVTMRISLPAERYETPAMQLDFYERLERGTRAIPGVAAVAVAGSAPMDNGGVVVRYRVVGRPAPGASGQRVFAEYIPVTPDYWRATGISLRRGRAFTDADRQGAAPVAIVNEDFVRREFGDADPIGSHIVLAGDVNRSAKAEPESSPIEIVGVVATTRHYGLQQITPPLVYVPMRQDPKAAMALVVRTQGDPMAIVPAIRDEMARLDSQLPIFNVRTLEALIRQSHALFSLNALLLGAFGASAWMLSLVGVYGVFSTAVAQRSREFGLRLALGARPGSLVGLVLWRAVSLSVVALVVGVAASWPAVSALSASMRSSMNVTLDASWGGAAAMVSAGMIVASIVACLIPATRASRTDPMVVWRES